MDMVPQLLILAAGASTRMGGVDKLLLPVAGTPLLAHVARTALATGLPVMVMLTPDRPLRRAVLAGLPVRSLTIDDPTAGMAASLASGVAALPATAPVLVLLADMPGITTDDLTAILAIWRTMPDMIVRATDDQGNPGHPVGFPAWAHDDLLRLTGDQGARQVLARYPHRLHSFMLTGRRATMDIDTPEDWRKWQGRVQ